MKSYSEKVTVMVTTETIVAIDSNSETVHTLRGTISMITTKILI